MAVIWEVKDVFTNLIVAKISQYQITLHIICQIILRINYISIKLGKTILSLNPISKYGHVLRDEELELQHEF